MLQVMETIHRSSTGNPATPMLSRQSLPRQVKRGFTFAAAKEGGTITFVSDSETDLLYSKAADKTTATEVTADPGEVNFTFGHMLSRVKFTFKNTFPENAAAKIQRKGCKDYECLHARNNYSGCS